MFSFFNRNRKLAFENASQSNQEGSETFPVPHYVSEVMEDDHGKFHIIKYWKKEERKTHIKGNLRGKYHGILEEEDTKSRLFNIKIYESELTNVEKLIDIPQYDNIKKFPKESLPEKISTCVRNGRDYYHINIHDAQFTDSRNISQKLQQTDGDESFGVIEGEIFGYVKDEVNKEIEEKIYVKESDAGTPTLEPTGNIERNDNLIRREYWLEDKAKTYWGNWEAVPLLKTNFRTGEKEYNGSYFREQFWYKGKKENYWGSWKYRTKPQQNAGCGTIFSYILWAILMLLFLPYLIYFLPFIILGLIIRFFQPVMKLLLPVIGVLFFIAFILNIFKLIQSPRNINLPRSIKDDTSETMTVEKIKSKENSNSKDSIITHLRKWQDYEKNEYSGKYSIKMSDFRKSHQFKNNLPESEYDFFIHSLKENDKKYLNGIYPLFEKLKIEKKLNRIQFAKMIVSFVQDIPYSLVLDNECNPKLYSDKYIQDYFKKPDASCDPNERYGINSPVEFLANLKGDCDTRTLLLYTLLDHYGYEVLLLSSDFYSHSILAIDLPVQGKTFIFSHKKYIIWETTSFLPPGILPLEISDQNKWNITLKSNNNGIQ